MVGRKGQKNAKIFEKSLENHGSLETQGTTNCADKRGLREWK
jgi:hypothetical protein